MPETYNPRDRSFIKKPEVKVCVTCGQPIAPDIKPMNNYMNQYVNKISGNMVILNSNDDTIEVQGVILHKVGGKADLETKQQTMIKKEKE